MRTKSTRRLRTALAVAVALSLPVPVGVGAATVPMGATEAAQAPTSDRATLVGTYRLIGTQVRDAATGEWSETPDSNSIGYITYADTGHMSVHLMRRNRTLFASNPPTGEEALTALRGFLAYFGSFTVDARRGVVVHHRVGHINPSAPVDATRFYDVEGERLILTPAPSDGGGREAATTRIVWERLPDAPLSAEARKFVGFYKLLYTDRYRERDGRPVFHGNENRARAGTSYIIYTPTGHMMVHLMQAEGRTKYAGAQPTPDEALDAYQTYSAYFGRFTTYENHSPPFVMHNQQGQRRPGGNVDATKRFYEFDGNILRLGGPPGINEAGETTGGHLYWERQPPIR